jgi:hypothetical protein
VLHGLDRQGVTTYFDRWQAPWEATIERVLAVIGLTPTLVDSTGAGDPVLESLQRKGRYKVARVYGYHFTAPSKQRLMEGLAVAIQRKAVRYPDDAPPKRVTVAELETFEYIYSRTGVHYSAPEGLHDDCVCALALAVQQLSEVQKGRAPGDKLVLL